MAFPFDAIDKSWLTVGSSFKALSEVLSVKEASVDGNSHSRKSKKKEREHKSHSHKSKKKHKHNHESSTRIIEYHNSSDFSSSDEEEDLPHNLKANDNNIRDVDVVHLPNGNILISNQESAEIDQGYVFDRRPDREVLITKSWDRKIVPKYILTTTKNTYVSSAQLLKRSYQLPSGAVTFNKSSIRPGTSKTEECFQSLSVRNLKPSSSVRLPRADRYFIPSNNILCSRDRGSVESLRHNPSFQHRSNIASSSFVPLIPFSNVDDEIMALKSSSSTNSLMDSNIVLSDQSLYNERALALSRLFSRTTSAHPEDVWTSMIVIRHQNVLQSYQSLASGSGRLLLTRSLKEERMMVDRQLALCAEAVTKCSSQADLHVIYETYLHLTTSYAREDKTASLWKEALDRCSNTLRLYHSYWTFLLTRASLASTLSVKSIADEKTKVIAEVVKNAQSLEVARLLTSGWSAKLISQSVQDLPPRLVHDIESFHIDLIFDLIQAEIACGYTEKSVALAQVSSLLLFIQVLTLCRSFLI